MFTSQTQQHGAELWRDEVNAAGGIKAGGKTYEVKFISYDDQSRSELVKALYTRLIVQDKVQFLFGPYSSVMTAPAVATCEQYGKIMLNTGGSDTAPYAHGTKYQFQLPAPAECYLASAGPGAGDQESSCQNCDRLRGRSVFATGRGNGRARSGHDRTEGRHG